MATSRTRKRQQQMKGMLPSLWQRFVVVIRWIVGHPQPMLIALVFSLTYWSIANFIQQAEAFKIAAVSMPANLSLDLPSNLIGKNIWFTNLNYLSEQLQSQRPDLKEIRVTRQLPNVIRVHAIERIAAAQVKLDRWYIVDTDGFILPGGTAQPLESLVRLSGFIRSEIPLKIGKLNSDERLKLALRILPVVRRSPALSSTKLLELNVSDMQQIRFVMDGDVEVRCGTEAELEAHLSRLQATLKLLAKQRPISIRYIDVRFQDPVISPEEA